MNAWLVTGASIAALLAVVHSYLGERAIVQPLVAADLKEVFRGGQRFKKAIIRFAWHLTSVAWLGFAFVLLGLGRSDAIQFIGVAIAATFVVHALVTALSSRFKHVAWIFFLIVAAGAYWGTH
jgi:hypothetical protein